MKKLLFEPPFGKLGGNVRTLSISCCETCGQLPIRHNWTFFAISYGWDITSGYLSKLAFFECGWVTLSAEFRWKGA